MSKKMEGVREHHEGYDVSTAVIDGRTVIEAKNEAGYNLTHVDLVDVIDWVRRERPELLGAPAVEGSKAHAALDLYIGELVAMQSDRWQKPSDGKRTAMLEHARQAQSEIKQSAVEDPDEGRRETLDALRLWAAHRYESEVEHRPRENMHRPALERVWGEVRAKFDAMAESPVPHVERFTDGELLRYCGADAARWAAAFCQIASKLGVVQLETLGHKPIDEGWMIGWFANAIMTSIDAYVRERPRLSASEAVYGVLGALTSRKEPRTFSGKHDASWAAEFAAAFCAVNDLESPREHWPRNLTHPPEDLSKMPAHQASDHAALPARETTGQGFKP